MTFANHNWRKQISVKQSVGAVTTDNAQGMIQDHPILFAVETASVVASVYHGYKRNNSIGWALVWGLLGAMFPIVTPTIAIAQGYAKPIKAVPNRRRRARRRK